jgi:hypothetical protein
MNMIRSAIFRSLRSQRPPEADATPTISVSDHPDTDAQPLDNDSDGYVQSLDDDSEKDVEQQIDDESEESVLPAGKSTH